MSCWVPVTNILHSAAIFVLSYSWPLKYTLFGRHTCFCKCLWIFRWHSQIILISQPYMFLHIYKYFYIVMLLLELSGLLSLHPQLIFWLFTLDSWFYRLPHDAWVLTQKSRPRHRMSWLNTCRLILVMVVDSWAKYAKEITKEKDLKGPYGINTCFNQVTEQPNWISTCTEITLTFYSKALINDILY